MYLGDDRTVGRFSVGMRVAVVFASIMVALFAGFAARAAADPFGIQAFDGELTAGPIPSPVPDRGNPADVANFPAVYTQAGGHPFALITEIRLNRNPDPVNGVIWPSEPLKDTVVQAPAGFVGNPTAVAKCSMSELTANGATGGSLCPIGSQVGVISVEGPECSAVNSCVAQTTLGEVPVYEMAPPPGVPARFASDIAGTIITLDGSVNAQPDGGYTLAVSSRNTSEGLAIIGLMVTLWGTPDDPAHNPERACPGSPYPSAGGPHCSVGAEPKAFLTMPTSCDGPMTATLSADSWFHPNQVVSASYTNHQPPGLPLLGAAPNSPETPLLSPDQWGAPQSPTGCDQVQFTPNVSVDSSSHAAGQSTGLSVSVSVPQTTLAEQDGIAQADIRKTVVQLPEGMVVNPSQANGLAACSPAQIALGSDSPPTCPDASKIGIVEIETPLLEEPLKGGVYLATQNENPFGSLLAVYLVGEGNGVVLKLAGRVDADPSTGRLTATFQNLPQQPARNVKVSFFGGSRAALLNPTGCGEAAVGSTLEGWNDGTVSLTSPYSVECVPGTGGFSPSFVAGTTNNQAGAFSPMAISLSRSDTEQQIKGLQFTMPPGVSAKLAGVPLCSNADAAAASCPASSRIGSVTVASGAGADPYFLKGSVYLTGPYNGGPFGDAVVVPAVAGPFNLGNVVVRGSIRVDPHTAQPTVVSDPLPQFVGSTGIPTDVRRVDVSLDREAFTFNPTDCDPLAANGTLTSVTGASASVSSRFQAANCATLPFHPSFTVSTQGKTSRSEGASLTVKVTSGAGQANIGKVHVSLPTQLPSRQATLNLACTLSVFEANPAACPSGSKVGTAKALTPILAGPLSGPAYLVSHGGAAFPDLEVVLQGEGITIILDGKTDIKNGVTSSSFDTVPDAPVSSFELNLPQGPHSILAAPGGKLCDQALAMPTSIVGQNGARISKSTPIEVDGCPFALTIQSRTIRKHTLTLKVTVPAAGKLTAHARGLRSASAKTARRTTLTLKLKAQHAGRLRTKVLLNFTPSKGRQRRALRKVITVTVR